MKIVLTKFGKCGSGARSFASYSGTGFSRAVKQLKFVALAPAIRARYNIRVPLSDLTAEEKEIVRCCLRASAEGPFFPDWEFHSLFGLERNEIREILNRWPDLDERDESVMLAINNSFNNLLGYPHQMYDHRWSQYIPVPENRVAEIFGKWKVRVSPIFQLLLNPDPFNPCLSVVRF